MANVGYNTLPVLRTYTNGGNNTLPFLQGTGTATTATGATGANTLPLLVATGQCGISATGHNDLPALTAECRVGLRGGGDLLVVVSAGSASVSNYARGANVLPRLAAQGRAASSRAGATGSNALPILRVAGSAHVENRGTGANTLPVLVANGSILVNVLTALTAQAFAVNMQNGGATEYSNFDFNSFCVFNGRLIGGSSAGVEALDGDTDNGTAIDAFFTIGTTDYGLQTGSKPLDVWLNCRTSEAMAVEVTGDDEDEPCEVLTHAGRGKLERLRATMPRGLDPAGNWKVKVSNQNGGDFSLPGMEVLVAGLSRRAA